MTLPEELVLRLRLNGSIRRAKIDMVAGAIRGRSYSRICEKIWLCIDGASETSRRSDGAHETSWRCGLPAWGAWRTAQLRRYGSVRRH